MLSCLGAKIPKVEHGLCVARDVVLLVRMRLGRGGATSERQTNATAAGQGRPMRQQQGQADQCAMRSSTAAG
jgi:hypothetical protein